SGAVSPWSGIFQSAFVLITLLLFAPFASHIPLASMAPILMIVAFNMSEHKTFTKILKIKNADSLVLVTTFLLTVFVNLTIAVPLVFGAADRFESTLSQAIHQRPTILILKMRHVALIDATGAANFKAFAEKFLAHDGKIFVTELYDEPMEILKQTGLFDMIGKENFYTDTTEAINHALTVIDTDKCPYCRRKAADKCRVYEKTIT